MLIYPKGLLQGDRLAECSDEAKLHFPRLVALANGYGRMELNARRILQDAYGAFTQKPTRDQLTSWFNEYADNHLLLAYTAGDGTRWGQWCGVPDNALPRFKTSADNKSPAPAPETVEALDAAYAIRKRERSEACGDSLDISGSFGNIPKSSEALKTFPPVVVVVGGGVGVGGVGEKQILASPAAPGASPTEKTKAKASQKAKDAVGTSRPYHPRFICAYERFPKSGEKVESEAEWFKAVERLEQGEKDKPPMPTEEAHAFLEDAAGDFATKTAGDEKKFIRGMRRWLLKSTYLDYAAKPKVVFVEVPDDQWLGGERLV
jgi:hypothetical protein